MFADQEEEEGRRGDDDFCYIVSGRSGDVGQEGMEKG